MNAEEAAGLLIKTLRSNTRNAVDRRVNYVQTGVPEVFDNPFTGKPTELPVSAETKSVAEKVRAAGLHKDAAFMRDFEKLLLACAEGPMFSLLSAFDGEGAFEGDIRLKITTAEGTPLPGYLNEMFYRDKTPE
jgi:hypothetical protein